MPYTGVPNQVSMLSRTHPLVRHNTHQVKDDGVIATGYLHCDGRLVVRDGADILPPVTHTHTIFFSRPHTPLQCDDVATGPGCKNSPVKHDRSAVSVLDEHADERHADENVVGVVVLSRKSDMSEENAFRVREIFFGGGQTVHLSGETLLAVAVQFLDLLDVQQLRFGRLHSTASGTQDSKNRKVLKQFNAFSPQLSLKAFSVFAHFQ